MLTLILSKQVVMSDFFKWLSSNQAATNIALLAFSLIVISMTLMYLVAFSQGRQVSFWPLQIGEHIKVSEKQRTEPEQGANLGSADNPASPVKNWISRRVFIPTSIGTLVGLTLGWLIGQQQASGEQRADVIWKMDTFLSESAKGTILYEAPKMVCDRVKEISGGRFIIELVRSGRTEEILNDVGNNNNEIDCGYNGIYYSTKKLKVLYFGCAIPFGLTPQEQNAWLYYKKDLDPTTLDPDTPTFMQSIYSRLGLNVITFPAGATGGQAGGWFRERVNSITDLNGKTMRIPGFGAEVLQKYGVTTHEQLTEDISVQEAVKRLADGRFGAVEWTGPYDDLLLGLDKAAKFYYFPGWWEPSTTFEVQVNLSKWNDLSPEFREVFKAACSEIHTSILTLYTQMNSKVLKEEIPQKGIELVRFSDEILQTAKDATKNLLDDYAEQDEDFKYVYDEWKSFIKVTRSWSKQNEMPSEFFLDF